MNVARPIKAVETDKSDGIDVEGNIRELVRRDGTAHREVETDSELAAHDLGALVHRASGRSTREIDNLIEELKGLRGKLQTDGDRVQREIAEYAALTQSVMQLTKIISEGVTHVKSPDALIVQRSEYKSPAGAGVREV
jgi:hypothetical protein